MALYPYTITAIAKNTTAGSNIVPGAMVSLLDFNGSAVVMYDDAAGSNGSTGKTADSRGQVTVYVEQGDYTLNVNGQANGKFTVSNFKNAVEVDTFASLQMMSPIAGQSFVCQERAHAKYIVQTSGYVAQTGDVTFANGRAGALQIDGVVNVGWFGFSSANTAANNDTAFSDFLARFLTVNTRDIKNKAEIPAGRYLINNITIGNIGSEAGLLNGRLIISGQGPLNTQLVCSSATGDAIKITSGRVELSNLSVTSDGINRSSVLGSGNGISIDSTDGATPASTTVAKFKLENIEVASQPDDGFLLVNTELLRGSGLTSELNGGYGFNFDGDNYGGSVKGISNLLENCRAYQNTLDGYRVNQTSESTFVNCQGLENDGDYQFWSNSRGTRLINPDLEAKTAATNLVGCLLAGDNSSIEGGLVFGTYTGVTLQGDGQVVSGVSFSNSGLAFNMTAVNTTLATNYTVVTESSDLSAKNVTAITAPIQVHDGGYQRLGAVTSRAAVAPSLNTFTITSNTPTAFGDNYAGEIKSATYNVLLTSNAVILVPTTFTNNQEFEIIFRQDGIGSRVVTFSGSSWKANWVNTGNTANAVSSIKFKVIFDDHAGAYQFIQIGGQSAYV